MSEEQEKRKYPQTPVRMYVLWHKKFEHGERLARRIYHWFRMESGEGIPVYYRCADSESEVMDIFDGCDHNVIIPLIDPHMVASFLWRGYLEKLCRTARSKKSQHHILPVAMDETAYQAPEQLSKLNFIRAEEADQDEVLLFRLTDAICHLLRMMNQSSEQAELRDPIRVFLSHAKADGTDVPIQIKNFIQSETQCHVFYDENDIPYGDDFKTNIEEAISRGSAGLITIQGDHFADRPWCRKEIRDFLSPKEPSTSGNKEMPPLIPLMPVVVVSNLKGKKVSRTIPELGSATVICWAEGAAREAVVTLLREILFSNFYMLLAKRELKKQEMPAYAERRAILLNRCPDHIILQSVGPCIKKWDDANKVEVGNRGKLLVYHPGHGLSGVEKDSLDSFQESFEFRSYGNRDNINGANVDASSDVGGPLYEGQFLAISAGNSNDLLEQGLGDEHVNELLRFILKPIFKEQMSLIYGGRLPDHDEILEPWNRSVNFTQTFLGLLLSERQKSKSDESLGGGESSFLSRLVNVSAWPYSENITIHDEAQWIHTCSFIRLTKEDAELEHVDPIPSLTHAMTKDLKGDIHKILCLSDMRNRICGELECDIPGQRNLKFSALAHLFLGGKTEGYSGILPGVWEEILCALEAEKPCFILGVARGAAGKIARLLVVENLTEGEIDQQLGLETPPEGKVDSYLDIDDHSSSKLIKRLKAKIMEGRGEGGLKVLLKNGLSQDENVKLLQEENFQNIAELIGKGLEGVLESNSSSGEKVRERT